MESPAQAQSGVQSRAAQAALRAARRAQLAGRAASQPQAAQVQAAQVLQTQPGPVVQRRTGAPAARGPRVAAPAPAQVVRPLSTRRVRGQIAGRVEPPGEPEKPRTRDADIQLRYRLPVALLVKTRGRVLPARVKLASPLHQSAVSRRSRRQPTVASQPNRPREEQQALPTARRAG